MKYISYLILSLLLSFSAFSQTIATTDNIFNYYLLEASKAKYHNDYNQALQLYLNCYKLDEKSSTVMYEISRIYYAAKKMDEANLWLDRAIKMDSTSNIDYIKYAATLKLYSGRYDQSKEYYKKLVSLESDIPTHKLMLARLYSQLNKPDSAHYCLDLIPTDQVPWSTIQLEHADLYTHELNSRKLEKTLKSILKREPNLAVSYKYLADYYFTVKEPKTALKYLNSGLSKSGGDALLIDLADYYYKEDNYTEFKSAISKAVLSVDITADTKRVKIASYLQQKDKELYLRNESDFFTSLISSASNFHPDDEGLSMLMASYYNFSGRQSECLSVMDSYFKSHSPGYDYFVMYISNIMSQKTVDWDKFTKVIDSAYELFPEQPYIVEAKVISLNNSEKYQESADILTEYISELADVQNNPQLKALKVEFLNFLAESYFKLNRVDDSFSTYDLIISLDPNHIVALNNYAYNLSLLDLRLDDAERMISKTISIEPNNSTYLDTYAWVLYKKKKYSMAQMMIEAALNNATEQSAELYEHYGYILLSLNDRENAAIQFKKAYELDNTRNNLLEFF